MKKLFLTVTIILIFTMSIMAGPPLNISTVPNGTGDDHPWGGDNQQAMTTNDNIVTDFLSWLQDQWNKIVT